MPLVLVFGSLRKHSSRGYNFQRFGKHEYIRTFVLKGYSMYSLGSYPTICKDPDNPDDSIVVELHEVDENNLNKLDRMEIGAGYTPEKIKVKEGEATIYTWPLENVKNLELPKVKSGDWN